MIIALLGYGRMGKLIEEEALKLGHAVVVATGKEDFSIIETADVCIDFSHASRVCDHVALACKAGKNIVIGTTGWEEHLEWVIECVEKHQIGAIASPNFSIGVQLFKMIVEEAADLIKDFHAYDVSGCEMHHKHKADAPSGTAKMLAQAIVAKMGINEGLEFSSVRCGDIPGTHTIIFDSPVDTITLTHQARSRSGFARGAVEAANWLQGKAGFYTIEDMIGGKHAARHHHGNNHPF